MLMHGLQQLVLCVVRAQRVQISPCAGEDDAAMLLVCRMS
jgi:hypothetical protein